MQNFLDSGTLFIGAILSHCFRRLFTAQSVLLTDLSFVNLRVHYTQYYVLFLGLNRIDFRTTIKKRQGAQIPDIHKSATEDPLPIS